MPITIITAAAVNMTTNNDNHYCIEGELVWLQEPCDRDKTDPDGPCGCGRGFAGAASHRATTTAMVVETAMTPDDLVLAFQTSLSDGGWPIIIVSKLEDYFLRGALLRPSGPSPERW